MSIRKNYDHLISLGIPAQKIVRSAGLLQRDPATLERNFNYFHKKLGLKKEAIQKYPQILAELLDAFAKKMRIFKLGIHNLKKECEFSPDSFTNFFLSSPASLIAKKIYCIKNEINFKRNIDILRRPWKTIIMSINSSISKKEAERQGKELTRPLKERYDKLMKEYKVWAEKFANRRGRRLIGKI